MLDVNNLLGWNSKSPQRSMIRLQGATASSTNTTVRTWTTVLENIGNDLVYARDPILGDTIRVVTDGVYSVSYSDTGLANATYGIIRNGNRALTTAGDQLPVNILAAAAPAAGTSATVTLSSPAVVLKAGDFVFFNCSPLNAGANAFTQLATMTKISS
jgi:hypothetical protein